MSILKPVFVFLLIFLVGRYPIANAQEAAFTTIKAGEKAPFTGYLFTPEAIVKVYSSCQEDVKRTKLECTADLQSLNLNVAKMTEIYNEQIESKDSLIEKITKLKNDQITARDNLLKQAEDDKNKNTLFIVGSFITGALITGTIFYFAAGVIK